MTTPLEQAWAQVIATPDDLEARQVLGDALQEAGEPHGELIKLQLEWSKTNPRREEIEEREEELISSNATALLGDPLLHVRLELDWEAGFVTNALAINTLSDLETLCHAPAGRLLRMLQTADMTAPVTQLAATLARVAPPTLKELRLGTPPLAGRTVVDVAPLFGALPHLERLDVTGLLTDFSGVSSERLVSLEVGSFLGTEPALTTLGAASLPALRELQVVLSDTAPHFPGAFLTGAGFTGLRELSLLGYLAPEHVSGLAASPLLARLSVLRLLPVPETGWVEALRQRAPRFRHLARLEILDTLDPKAALPDLSDVLENVVLGRGAAAP